MKKKDKKYKTIPSSVILAGSIFYIVLSIGVFLLLMFTPNIIEQCNEKIWYWFALVFILLISPFIFLLLCARRFLSIVTIDENGISRSVFGRFFKLSMKWDDIYEISYFERVLPYLIISKTKSIQGMSYGKITKIKDLIQIQLSQKNYVQIKQYINQPIVGLPEKVRMRLEKEKEI